MAHTNGIESFLAMLKRANLGVLRHFSFKQMYRYVAEATGRHNVAHVGATARHRHQRVRQQVAIRRRHQT